MAEVSVGAAAPVGLRASPRSPRHSGRNWRTVGPNGGEFTLGGDCPLPNSSVWTEGGGGAFRGADLPNAAGAPPQVSLVGAEEGTVRTALAPLGDGSGCLDQQTYADADTAALPEAGEDWELLGAKLPVDLPEQKGHYALCAVRGSDYDGAATVLFQVDRTPPLFPASASVEDIGDGAVVVQPHLNPPDTSTVRFTYGDPDTTDCADTASFRDFFIVPLTLMADDLPAAYCVYGLDTAGNASDVTRIDIPKR